MTTCEAVPIVSVNIIFHIWAENGTKKFTEYISGLPLYNQMLQSSIYSLHPLRTEPMCAVPMPCGWSSVPDWQS